MPVDRSELLTDRSKHPANKEAGGRSAVMIFVIVVVSGFGRMQH
jgi:hypothetical protein